MKEREIKTEQLLKEAFLAANIRMAEEAERKAIETDNEWIPSPEFKAKMEKQVKAQRRTKERYLKTMLKSAAILFVVFSIAFTCMTTVNAKGMGLGKFVVSVFKKELKIEYLSDKEKQDFPEEIERTYDIPSISEKYELIEQQTNKIRALTTWGNKESGTIVLCQTVMTGDIGKRNRMNADDYSNKEYDDDLVYLSTEASFKIVMWSNGLYEFQLISDINMTFTEFDELARRAMLETYN